MSTAKTSIALEVAAHNSHKHHTCPCRAGDPCFMCVWAIDRGKQLVAIAREWGMNVRPMRVQVGNLISDDYRRLEMKWISEGLDDT